MFDELVIDYKYKGITLFIGPVLDDVAGVYTDLIFGVNSANKWSS